MSPEDWQKIKDIIADALALPRQERAALLNSACGEDTELRKEVEKFLDFEDGEGSFLEGSPVEFEKSDLRVSENGSSALVNKQIGNYKITREIGAGGMGAVFLAERVSDEFSQRVAVKLVKAGINSRETIRRFHQERRILASLEHPFIARLIDGGRFGDGEGMPYFVMEYIEGSPINEYADANNLTLLERLYLFRKICEAVEYAHRNLVIHRDLKPSNILITEDAAPRLLDFGIAKLLKDENANESGETNTQQFAFTPEYASPEQLRGEKLTTATDIYSLGVVLYELLTGVRPFQSSEKNIGKLISLVTDSEPPRPSSAVSGQWLVVRNKTAPYIEQRTKADEPQTNPKSKIQNPKSLKGDLDNIILKSLRREPERRYSTVKEFSEDIRRHLEGLPVSASKDTWSYRAQKFIQRNRVAVGAAGLILLTLLAGLGATAYQANVAQRERTKAEQRFRDVRQLANSFLFEFHDAIETLSGSTPARKLVVSRAVEYLDKLASEAEDDPTLQRELGTAYEKIGRIQGNSYFANLGDTEGAMKSYNRSLEIRRRLAEADPENRELQYELARSWRGVGDMLYTIDDLKGGLQAYENGIAILNRIVAQEPDNLKYLNTLSDTLSHQGDIKGMEGFQNLGDTKGALESYRRSVEIGEKLVTAEPANAEYSGDLATHLIYFGRLQSATGDFKGAISSGQKSISIFEKLSAAEPDNFEYKKRLIVVSNSMRLLLLDEGRSQEALDSARSGIKTLEEMIAKDPKNFQLRRGLGVVYNALGMAQLQIRDVRGAIDSFHRSLSGAEELSAADPKSGEPRMDVLTARQLLAEAQIEAGEFDSALLNLRQNVATYEETLREDSTDKVAKDKLALSLALTGRALSAKGNLSAAAEAFRRAVSSAEEVLQAAEPNTRSKNRHALSFFEAGKAFKAFSQIENPAKKQIAYSEACKYFQRSFEIWEGMRQTGTLSSIYVDRHEQAARELANCN